MFSPELPPISAEAEALIRRWGRGGGGIGREGEGGGKGREEEGGGGGREGRRLGGVREG